MTALLTGLDLGGAHLKAAQATPEGRVVAAVQVPCPLWQGLDRLREVLAEVTARLAPIGAAGITMTGELVDLFPDRASGVVALAGTVAESLPEARPLFWTTGQGFVPPEAVPPAALEIASANWLAAATLAARRVGTGLFVDLGSTTTDILVLAGGRAVPQGTTDRERLVAGELVYTGLTRSFAMALGGPVPFAGRLVPLMNEHFATSADIYRVFGTLPEAADQHPAADDGEKTVEGSVRRLARMIGADAGEASPEAWRRVAACLAERQLRQVEDALRLQLSRDLVPAGAPLVGAGCGRHLLPELARRTGLAYRDFADLLDVAPAAEAWAATCAPAVAVALLAAEAVSARW